MTSDELNEPLWALGGVLHLSGIDVEILDSIEVFMIWNGDRSFIYEYEEVDSLITRIKRYPTEQELLEIAIPSDPVEVMKEYCSRDPKLEGALTEELDEMMCVEDGKIYKYFVDKLAGAKIASMVDYSPTKWPVIVEDGIEHHLNILGVWK